MEQFRGTITTIEYMGEMGFDNQPRLESANIYLTTDGGGQLKYIIRNPRKYMDALLGRVGYSIKQPDEVCAYVYLDLTDVHPYYGFCAIAERITLQEWVLNNNFDAINKVLTALRAGPDMPKLKSGRRISLED